MALHIVASEPVSQAARFEPSDCGVVDTTVLRQRKTARLQKGKTVSFQNLLYATNEAVGRNFDVRRLTDQAAMVKGRSRELKEVAAMGTGGLGPLESAGGECRLWYLSEHALAVSGARRITLKGRFEAESPEGFALYLVPGDKRSTLRNPGSEPVEITFRCEPGVTLKVAGSALEKEKRVGIDPGEHALEVDDLPGFFRELDNELTQLWQQHEPSGTPVMAEPKPDYPDPWREAWRHEWIAPPLELHRTLKAGADPATTVGTPEAWVDRRLPYRTPLAGWQPGTNGAAMLDLWGEADIDSVRLVAEFKYFAAFKEGGASFEIVLSNDNFVKDVRRIDVPSPQFDVRYAVMGRGVSRFPSYILPVGQRARHIKIVTSWPGLKKPVVFGEIEVTTSRRASGVKTELFARDFFGKDRMGLLASSGRRLAVFQADGKLLWEHELESDAMTVTTADVNSDGKQEIIASTQAEKMHVYNSDGTPRFVHNAPRQGKVRAVSYDAAVGTVGAWRPDKRGNLEYCLFPHVKYGRITAEPELKRSLFRGPGGKFVFSIPDMGGDGRQELGIVGRYGGYFAVLDSQSKLDESKLQYLTSHVLPGHSSGNHELRQYYDGAVVRDAQDRWLGVIVLNDGCISYYAAPGLSPAWDHFNHPSNRCRLVSDLDGDGVPEVLVGREDGFATEYALADGKVIGTVFAGGEIRALAALGKQVAVGTANGLVLLDEKLEIVGYRPGPVSSLAVLNGSASSAWTLAAALDTGEIVGLRLR